MRLGESATSAFDPDSCFTSGVVVVVVGGGGAATLVSGGGGVAGVSFDSVDLALRGDLSDERDTFDGFCATRGE